VLWKMQRWTPNTCDDPPCQILQLWDADAPSVSRQHLTLAIEHACTAHPVTADISKARWQDGTYYDRDTLIEQQREWFNWRRGARQDEPVMPVSVSAPPANEQTSIETAVAWVFENNQRWNLTKLAARAENAGIDLEQVVFWFVGVGDARVLHVDTQGQLTNPQITRVQNAADIQFGAGKVVIEG